MKTARQIGIVVLIAAGLGRISPAAAQGELDRLESGIRKSNGQPAATIAAGQRVYLGAVADDDAGRGVRVLSVRAGGPADRAGLKAQDLVVTAAGRKVRLLSELTTILGALAPGDRLSLELMRGNQMVRTEVVVAAVPGIAPLPPPTSLGPGRTDAIPPPPGEVAPPDSATPVPPLAPPPEGSAPAPPLAPSPEGPTFSVPAPQPVAPMSPQAQIEELRRRVDQLEHKVQELEHALAEQRK